MMVTRMIKAVVMMTMIMGRDFSHVSSVGACRPIGLESVVGLEATVVLGGLWWSLGNGGPAQPPSLHLDTLLDFGPSNHHLLRKQ